MKEKKKEEVKQENKPCSCDENCNCGGSCECEDCNCGDECNCGETCECEACGCGDACECEDCNCESNHSDNHCNCEPKIEGNREMEFLNLAKQIKADFDNYRRRVDESLIKAKLDGQISVLEAFLPCLDTFVTAKEMIKDEVVLEGVNMIENRIKTALSDLGVKEISSLYEIYNPNLHNVVAVTHDDNYEDDIIVNQFQAGYTFKDKVIRYSKVVINKKEN